MLLQGSVAYVPQQAWIQNLTVRDNIVLYILCYMLLQGSVAYVPQQAWIQNLTVRDNIVFGREFKAAKYRKVVENCCLKSDLDMLAHGDKTELGEKASP